MKNNPNNQNHMKKSILILLTAVILTACNNAPATEDKNDVQETAKTYTLEEVAKHTTPDDCWLILDDKVYDVSGYGDSHPGGEVVYDGCGIDATEMFNEVPHSQGARTFAINFYIGDLES